MLELLKMKIRIFFRNVTALQKGMILILVPLLLEFTVLGILAKALVDADQRLTQIEHSRQAVRKLVDFENSCQVAFCTSGLDDEGPAKQLLALDKLDSLVGPNGLGDLNERSDPELKSALQSLKTLIERSRALTQAARQVFEQQSASAERLNFVPPKFEALNALLALRRFSRQVVQTEYLVLGTEPEKLRGLRLQLVLALVLVILLSVSVSLLLAWFFTSDITNRLKRIADNAHGLSTNKPLPTPEEGNDEIAQLEHILYYSSAELKQLRRKEFAILDNAADVICSLDENLNFVEVSAAVAKVWNRSKEELLGQPLSAVLAETQPNDTAAAFRHVADQLTSGEVENLVRCASGFVKDSLWRVKWSAIDRRFFCVVHDVTELRAIEKLKHHFLQIVCHDLRSPLMSISIDLDLVTSENKKGLLAHDVTGELSNVSANLRYLGTLVTEFLELEQFEAGKMSMEMLMVSASDLCLVAKESLETMAAESRIQIELLEGDGLVWGDEKALVQAVKKLLANAISVSPPTATVQMSISVKDRLVKIKVTDQGPEIPLEQRDFVFERFALRSHDRLGDKKMNSGLVMVKNIACAHGGQVGVESERRGVTSLWIQLPQYVPEQEDGEV
jgi:PAS domain S-box-containing protein